MIKKKHSYPPIHIGTSFMLVIFVVLCMVIFAVLSLSSAQKDYSYSEKNALRTTQYYEACNLAEEKLAQIDAKLQEESLNGIVSEEIIEFAITVNDKEQLQIVLETHPKENSRYTIKSWKITSTEEWNADTSLPVLGGK